METPDEQFEYCEAHDIRFPKESECYKCIVEEG